LKRGLCVTSRAFFVNSIVGVVAKKEYNPKDFRLALLGLIVTHLQFVFGIILYFVSSKIQWFNDDITIKEIMKSKELRLYNVEHPSVMLIAIVLLTIGYSKHKKKLVSHRACILLFLIYICPRDNYFFRLRN